MKSIRRCQHVMTVFILLFLGGTVMLIVTLTKNADFYMTHSENYQLGVVYDRSGDVLFDGTSDDYESGHFKDVGNLIGDDNGQMENTLVAQNLDKLNNYSFVTGLRSGGKAAIYTTLDHKANRAVYDAFMGADGCAVAYDYTTGELLVCTSLPNIDPTDGYGDIENMRSGTLMSKAMYRTVPGSTQKVCTVISAMEIIGQDALFAKSYTCNGYYINGTDGKIDCHNPSGHGEQNIQQAVENSCNPFFAQLIEDADIPLERIKDMYTRLGYAVSDDYNDPPLNYIDIDGIRCETASTTLTDSSEFSTQWGCIGQGDTLVSPMQLMMWQSAIANETGKVTMPHLVSYRTDVNGNKVGAGKTEYGKPIFTAATASAVKQILLTNGANHYNYSIPGFVVGIKSGTAQVKEGAEENALLVGFSDDPKFPVAFCVVLENKYSTPAVAENIVTTMLNALSKDYYLD